METDETAFGTARHAVRSAPRPGEAGHALQLDEAALGRLRELDPSGSSRLIERVFDAFESSLQRMLPALAVGLPITAPTLAQFDALRLIVHTLKSSAATVGASAMSRQCGDLEAMLRDGRTAGVAERIAGLLAETVRVRQALRAVTGGAA